MTRPVNKLLSVFFLLLLLAGTAHAITLQEAKEQGLVGEQRDGYVGLVTGSAPEEVRALVRQVNEQRRQRYEQIANENDIAMEQVTALAYAQAVEATRPGHFIQLPNGAWQRK